jgi:Tfp pilus assembly protein PilO
MDRNRLWTIGAGLAMVVVLVMGWFLGIQPQLSSATTAGDNLATTQTQNAASSASIAKLKTDFEGITKLTQDVATLRESVPSSAQISAFVTELDSLAGQHQVEVKSIGISDAKAYTPPAVIAAAPAAGTSPSPSPSPIPTATNVPVSAPAAPTAPVLVTNSKITAANFIAIPVQLSIKGPYSNVLEFVRGLQTGPRLFLVTTMSTKPPGDKASAGSVDASVGGLVYVLLANGASVAGGTSGTSGTSEASTK